MRTLITAIFFTAVSLFLISCEDAGNEYFFESPVSGSVLKNVKCVNGSVSYIGFVVDNTEKYGARIMKITGCGKKIDKGFKDDADDKTGIFIGGSGVGVDQLVKDGNVILGVISSGHVDYDHYKNDDKKLEAHRGRLVLRTLVDNFQHDKTKDSSVLLDFHPALVKSDGEGFFVYGTYFGVNYLAYIKTDGTKLVAETDIKVEQMTFSNGKVLLYNGSDKLFTINSDLELQIVWEGNPEKIKRSGVNALSGGRTALYYNRSVIIFDHNFNIEDIVVLPESYIVSSVVGTEYTEKFLFRSFPQEKMNEKVTVYTSTEDEVDNDSDTETTDADDLSTDSDEEIPDNDSLLTVLAVTDEDTESDDTDSDVKEDNISGAEILDAQEADVIWIATETGNVLSYDLASKSWLVTYYDENDAEDTAEYSLEMRPYLDSSFTSYPEYGTTNLDNAPFIKKISVARGLAESVVYNFTYEGMIQGSRSLTGTFDPDSMIFADKNTDFTKTGYDTEYDRVILLERKQNSECIIPLNTNITMDIITVDSPTEMTVEIEEFRDSISACYGEDLSYGIYTENKYCVTSENVAGKAFAGRADELSASASEDETSFSDQRIDISIKRKTDEVKTSKETNYYIKINPGVPFVGINSNDLIVDMEQTVPGNILMFSPLTRRFIEYDVINRTVVEVYK